MAPLEAAQSMADEMDTDQCPWCRVYVGPGSDGHASDCPWLMLPQIVAALEAAQAFVDWSATQSSELGYVHNLRLLLWANLRPSASPD